MKTYKAIIRISLRKGILDVQGKTVENGLRSIGFNNISNVRIGRIVELNVEAEVKTAANNIVADACKKLIANPIIEDFAVEIEDAK